MEKLWGNRRSNTCNSFPGIYIMSLASFRFTLPSPSDAADRCCHLVFILANSGLNKNYNCRHTKEIKKNNNSIKIQSVGVTLTSVINLQLVALMTGRGSSNHPASLNVQERRKKDGWEDESNAVTDFNCWSFKCPSVLLHHPTWLQLQPWQLKPISSSLQGGVSLPWQSLDAWLHWCFHAPPVLEQNSLGL